MAREKEPDVELLPPEPADSREQEMRKRTAAFSLWRDLGRSLAHPPAKSASGSIRQYLVFREHLLRTFRTMGHGTGKARATVEPPARRSALPQYVADSAPEPVAHTPTRPLRKKILVVSIRPLEREALRDLLRQFKVDCHVAGDLGEALQKFHTLAHEIGAIILDSRLPDPEHRPLINYFRELNPNVPIIVLASINDRERAQKMSKQGAIGLLERPVTGETLSRVLNGLANTFCG